MHMERKPDYRQDRVRDKSTRLPARGGNSKALRTVPVAKGGCSGILKSGGESNLCESQASYSYDFEAQNGLLSRENAYFR